MARSCGVLRRSKLSAIDVKPDTSPIRRDHRPTVRVGPPNSGGSLPAALHQKTADELAGSERHCLVTLAAFEPVWCAALLTYLGLYREIKAAKSPHC